MEVQLKRRRKTFLEAKFFCEREKKEKILRRQN
jgi:hypothetical protein